MKFLIILALQLIVVFACSSSRNKGPFCCNQLDVQCCCLDKNGNEIFIRWDYTVHFPPGIIEKSKYNCGGCVNGFRCYTM